MASLYLKIDLENGGRIGPGKIELLEHIATFGSIAAAGRAMDMSYRRAWLLVEEMNKMFGRPVVSGQTGGVKGGGAVVTDLGLAIIARFRAIERAASDAARLHIAALEAEVAKAQPITAT